MATDVIKYRTCILTAIWLLVAALSTAQVGSNKLKKRVTVYHNETRVDSFLNLLAKQTGIGFSFNSKKISPTMMIPIRKGIYTVEECLLKIQQTAGIHYALLSNHIILVDNPPQEKYRLQLSQKPPSPTATVKRAAPTKPVVTKRVVTPKPVATVPDRSKRQEPIIQKTNVDSIAVQTDSFGNDSTARIDSTIFKDSTGRSGLYVRKNSTVRDDSKDGKGLFGRIGLFSKKDSTDRNDSTERNDSTQAKASNPNTNTIKKLPPSKKTTAPPAQSTAAAGGSRRDRSDRKVRIDRGTPTYGDNQRNRDKDWNLIAGASLLRPDFAYMNIGIGAHVTYEHFFGNKWSLTGSVGYDYIMGNYMEDSFHLDTFYVAPWKRDTVKHFSFIPVLVGLRYYVSKPVYLSFETGYSIKADSAVASCMSFSPAVGAQIPVGNGAIDVNINYLWLKEKMTIPEKTRFQKGGLGFWCLRVAWVF
jgi:hypothetical protein